MPLDRHSVFEIASITRVFTGILLADMVRRGDVALDDPVSTHLPADVTARRSTVGFDPAAGTGVVVLTDTAGEGADDIGFHLLDADLSLRRAERTEPSRASCCTRTDAMPGRKVSSSGSLHP